MSTDTIQRNGLTLGPLDPDNSSELTRKLGVHNKADRLLKNHMANWPVELTKALSLPRADVRSEALDFDEVESALKALSGRRAFFKDGDTFEDASVRGPQGDDTKRIEDLIVSVVYRKKSDRSAVGVIPYSNLEGSLRAYAQLKLENEAEKRGVPLAALQPAAAGGTVDEAALAQAQADAEAHKAAAETAEAGRREAEGKLADLADRIAALENPAPFPGYDELNALDRAAKVKEGGLDEYGRAGLERIYAYEVSHKDSAQVKKAIEAILETTPETEGGS